MTSFLAWLAVDQRRPSALYFASDSRRSWPNREPKDDCVKLFAPATGSADIFGFCGDVAFPARAIPDLCKQMELLAIPPGQASSMYGRVDWVSNYLNSYLESNRTGFEKAFSIFHGARNGFGMNATFCVYRHEYDVNTCKIVTKEIEFSPDKSCKVEVSGSGFTSVTDEILVGEINVGSVSRIYFSTFCDALQKGQDKKSGGAPQLLGLGNTGAPRHHGIFADGTAFFQGKQVVEPLPADIQWRNTCFERVDQNGILLKGAQRHGCLLPR